MSKDNKKEKLAKRVFTGVIKVKNSKLHRYGTVATAAGIGIKSGLKAKTLIGKTLRGLGAYAVTAISLVYGQGYVLGRNHEKEAIWENGVGQCLKATEFEATLIDHTQKKLTKLFNKKAKATNQIQKRDCNLKIAAVLSHAAAMTQTVEITDAGIYGASDVIVDYAKPVHKGGIEKMEILDTRRFLLDAHIKGF